MVFEAAIIGIVATFTSMYMRSTPSENPIGVDFEDFAPVTAKTRNDANAKERCASAAW